MITISNFKHRKKISVASFKRGHSTGIDLKVTRRKTLIRSIPLGLKDCN